MSELRVLVFISSLFFSALAGAIDTTEYQIKAAYMYKFAAYIEWPASTFPQADAPITIGVLGADDMEAALRDMTAKNSIQDRAVVIKRFNQGTPLQAASLADTHILFIGQKESKQLKYLLEPLQSQPVLIVTESSNALSAGSIINFIPIEDRIRFEVSVLHAERNGLKISSRLLSVAQNIESGRP